MGVYKRLHSKNKALLLEEYWSLFEENSSKYSVEDIQKSFYLAWLDERKKRHNLPLFKRVKIIAKCKLAIL